MVLYEFYGTNEEVLLLQLKKFDQEPDACRGKLFEYDVTFPPRLVVSTADYGYNYSYRYSYDCSYDYSWQLKYYPMF